MSQHQKNTRGLDTPMASRHLSERREARYSISFPIEIAGVSRDGQAFRETTHTLNVSEWGCGFLSSLELKADDIILLRRLPTAADRSGRAPREAFFQVVRVERKEHAWLIGAWKMESADVWGEDLVKLGEPDEGRRESRKPHAKEESAFTIEKKDP